MTRFMAGDFVQTPLGKGIVRDVRNKGALLVEVGGRSIIIDEAEVQPTEQRRVGASKTPRSTSGQRMDDGAANRTGREVDLHGLTVEEALSRAESAINDALLAHVVELRVIHGRSGRRIRAALHRRLREIRVVRAFRLDPRNEGVTVISF